MQLGSCHQGSSPALYSWAPISAPGLGHGHLAPGLAWLSLARAFLIPTMGAQSIYSAQLTLNKTLSRDILLSSPLPCTFLSPFYLLGRGRGEGTGKKRFTLSWGEGGVTVIMVCSLHLARGQT